MQLLKFYLLCALLLSPLSHGAQAFQQSSFEAILRAEFAFEQGDYQGAQQTYLEQALQLDNAYLAKRASQAAFYNEDQKALLDSAKLWQRLQKDEPQALAMLALAQVYNGLYNQAFSNMAKRANITGESEFYLLFRQLPNQHPSQTMVTRTLQQFVLQNPNNSDALLALASLYQQQDKPQQSYDNLKSLINKKTSSNAELKNALAVAEKLSNGMTVTLYQLAIKKHPKNTDVRYQYAQFLSETQPEKAKAQLQVLLKINPKQQNAQFFLGLLNLQTTNYSLAVEQFQQLLNKNPDFTDAWYYLGAAFFEQKQYPKAEQAFAKAFKQQVTDKNQTALIKSLWRNKKQTEAKTLLSQAIAKSDQPNPWYYLRAMLHQQAGLMQAVEQDLQKVLLSDPNHIEALNALGYIWADNQQNLDQALVFIKKAHQLAPDRAAILDSLGWVLYRLGRNDETIMYLQQAVKKWPNGEISAHLIEVLWQSGQQQAAKTLIQKTLQQQPEDPHLHETLQRLAIDHPANS